LQAVREVPLPHGFEARGGHQVLPLVLRDEKRGEPLKTGKPGGVDAVGAKGARFGFTRYHAALRANTSTAASAAGVTPRTLPAAARFAGRALERRSTISFERPGISE